MFGCIGGLFRFAFVLVLLAVVGGGAYYYLRLHPEKAPWKGGVASVQEGMKTVKLSTEVKAALSLRESLKNIDISVSAEKDVITLRGLVPSPEVAKAVESIASAVPGVRQVVSFMEVDRTAGTQLEGKDDRSIGEKVDDQALELKVRAAFRLDKELASAGFDVTSTRRALRLSSGTATALQKKRALEVARSVEDVASVELR